VLLPVSHFQHTIFVSFRPFQPCAKMTSSTKQKACSIVDCIPSIRPSYGFKRQHMLKRGYRWAVSGHTHVRYTHADRNFANQTHTGSEETMNVNTQHFVANPLSSTMSLPAASPGTSHPWPDVCHKWDFCRDGWTDRTVFWHGSFFRRILHCILRKFGCLQN